MLLLQLVMLQLLQLLRLVGRLLDIFAGRLLLMLLLQHLLLLLLLLLLLVLLCGIHGHPSWQLHEQTGRQPLVLRQLNDVQSLGTASSSNSSNTHLWTDLELLHRICDHSGRLWQCAAHALCDLRRSGCRCTGQLRLGRYTLPGAGQLDAHSEATKNIEGINKAYN
uniref:IP05434p n=1 Tax=Drosophila melanogaster TaxID=7227 RepID=Q4V6A5_DROME|nr:IP05434p [Drosophila melanogaster]